MRKIIVLCLLLAANAFAEREGGGGDVFVRGNQVTLLDLAEIDARDVDFFNPTLFTGKGALDNLILDVGSYCSSDLGAFLLRSMYSDYDFIETSMSGMFAVISSNTRTAAFAHKPLTWIYTENDLSEIADEGVISLNLEDGNKKQLAIQKDGVVVVNKVLSQRLDQKSKVAFPVHEGLIRAMTVFHPQYLQQNGTQDIRRLVRLLSNANPNDYAATRKIHEACEKLPAIQLHTNSIR